MEKIGFIAGEFNAEIIRGMFEAHEIKSSISSWTTNKEARAGGEYAIFVEASKLKEATELLKEKGFLLETEDSPE